MLATIVILALTHDDHGGGGGGGGGGGVLVVLVVLVMPWFHADLRPQRCPPQKEQKHSRTLESSSITWRKRPSRPALRRQSPLAGRLMS